VSAHPARGVLQGAGSYGETGVSLQCYVLGWRTFVSGGIMAGVFAGAGCFYPECLAQISIVWGSLISVTVQDMNKIGQSVAKL